MPYISEISSTSNPATQTKLKLEGFVLARDTLKKLPLAPHEIDAHGFPCISGNTNLDQRFERINETNQYMAHFYATNLSLKEKFKENAIENLNKILEDISTLNPSTLAKQPLSYIIKPDVLRSPHVIALIHNDPLITLNLITGKGCGLNSGNLSAKEGALNILIVLGKIVEHSIQSTNNINNNLINNLSNLSLIRGIIYRQKGKVHEPMVTEHIRVIDNELEQIEANALGKCIRLKNEPGKELNTVQEEKKEEIIGKIEEKKTKEVVIGSLNFLD